MPLMFFSLAEEQCTWWRKKCKEAKNLLQEVENFAKRNQVVTEMRMRPEILWRNWNEEMIPLDRYYKNSDQSESLDDSCVKDDAII